MLQKYGQYKDKLGGKKVMLDFEAISRMNVDEWCNYVTTLDVNTIVYK